MAEWVLKGSLKGPQGDPGQDAQLPAGGTEGQVLTKTSGGEAWADVPEPDMTGVVKYDGSTFSTSDYDTINGVTLANNATVDQINLLATNSGSSIIMGSETSAYISVQDTDGHEVSFRVESPSSSLTIDSKAVSSITDDASTGDTNALATAKAVKDYVDAHGMPSVVPISRGGTGATTAEGARTALGIPDIEVATDEEFDSYMGLS